MKRTLERPSWLQFMPDDHALLSRQGQRLFQVREKGDGAVQRRQDARPGQGQQLQRLVELLRREWEEAPDQGDRDLERLLLAHLLGVWGGLAKDGEPASVEPVQPAAARSQRAKEKHRAAPREKSPRQEPARQRAWLAKSRKRAAGADTQAARALALPPSPPSPPDKARGKRAPSMAGGGRRHPDPWGGRGMDVAKPNPLGAAAQDTKHLEERAKETAREGRRQPGKGLHCWTHGPNGTAPHPGLEGKRKDPEELWPVGSTRRREVVTLCPLSKRGGMSQWQRELERAFEELFASNRTLKRHLSLYLEPRMEQHALEEEGSSGARGQRAGTQGDGERTGAAAAAGPLWESWSPEEVGALQTPPRGPPETAARQDRARRTQGGQARAEREAQEGQGRQGGDSPRGRAVYQPRGPTPRQPRT
ncbi:CEP295 N-terminal-like protein isoform X1 [Dasypus novemcinctus]|uniref:CEP295 N-terminal-like protein isoform X1 n=1 Tax=Dasypus novemcinctus TaxID=9361 RepID=UPI00265FB0BB|nr:metalloproteinase inhibitor 2 isoform X1 [Dasypus novemcinctus]XP_058140807.1 metalloproteinase inhibitor 2 isoform X1 [Dasypus novemcinctus]XP_058140808.1 metalloproteinase inhibitor 2 isoform X1 [Dasypus novemcinctus]XP_058140809.1 metalloproteinase inhibitor 2 isoform X1 [Dasypus novemcinctus]